MGLPIEPRSNLYNILIYWKRKMRAQSAFFFFSPVTEHLGLLDDLSILE